jgi:hypothetical protein
MSEQMSHVDDESTGHSLNGAEEVVFDPGLKTPKQALETGPVQLDGIELGRIRRQEQNTDSRSLDACNYLRISMSLEVIHDEDVTCSVSP